MIFSTVTFVLYFLAPLMIVYYLAPKPAKNILLLAASAVFGFFAGIPYMLIPAASVVINYFLGKLLGKHRSMPILAACAAANALLPVLFRLFMSGNDIKYIAPVMILFCGTCLCSLRAMTYFADLYTGTTAIQTNIMMFATYMLFFPLFPAGPVVKYNDFRIMLEKRRLIGVRFLSGAGLFACGILKKFIIADRMRNLWLAIAGYDYTGLGMAYAWLGFIALILYIWFMVSSFMDMGVGMSRMLGMDISRRLHPVKFAKKAGKLIWIYLPALAAAAACVLTAFSLKGMGEYAAAMFRFGYTGWGEQDLMYRLASNIGTIILAIVIASGLIRFIIDALKPAKVKNTPAANAGALVVMAAMIAVAAINLVSIAGHSTGEKNTGSFMDGTWIRQADSRSSAGSFFTNRLFRFNADIGYILGQRGLNGVHYSKSNTLIERPAAYNEEAVDRFVEEIDYLSDRERYETYIAVIPPAFEIMKNSLKSYTYDDRALKVTQRIGYLLSDSAIKYCDCTDALISYSDEKIFRSTESELTADGSYAVYKALGELLGYEPHPRGEYEKEIEGSKLRGVLWAKAGTDTIEPDNGDRLSLIGGDAHYVGTDGPADAFNSSAGNGRSLVIVGDRYARGIAELAAEHFDLVYELPADLDTESLKQFINEKYVTDLLVLIGTDTVTGRRGQ